MKELNAAERIRERLGCDNIMMHVPPVAAKPKKVRYGDLLKAAFDAKNRTPARLRKHTEFLKKKAGPAFKMSDSMARAVAHAAALAA